MLLVRYATNATDLMTELRVEVQTERNDQQVLFHALIEKMPGSQLFHHLYNCS